MNIQIFAKPLLFVLFITICSFSVSAQTKTLLKRTIYKTDKLDFGPGGTLVVNGAPNGSIRVEGWNQNEIELSAEIHINAETENDIEQLTKVTGFLLEESLGRTGIMSFGTHDKSYLKSVSKKFPKHLIGMPFSIDYVIKVPRFCDLQINGGKGDLNISGVEGIMKINYLETNAVVDLVGGGITATFGSGDVVVKVPTRGWRGRFADIQLASGTMHVSLPPGLNAEIDASILRSGKIENEYASLKPRTRKVEFTEKLISAKSGVGGVPLKFTVGDGTLNIFANRKPD
ncbi:MAG: DUF4097 domain-containing protein [Acidobacteriota bacterium]|nr:hypothetical protein [Blastocatellia bacterium]MDQ3489590.1 DUF4097 domain-containing protein [Acidobacteriota bacterium]